MSISYEKEQRAWDLSKVTDEEKEQLFRAGMSYLIQRLGAQVLEQEAARHGNEELLHALQANEMPQA